MADSDTPIGSLRYQLQLVARVQTPDPNGFGIIETAIPVATLHASITPIGMMTFWSASTPIEMTPTHRLRFRGDQYLSNVTALVRTRTLNEGIVLVETYRVMRTKLIDGRNRFTECECRLETVVAPPG